MLVKIKAIAINDGSSKEKDYLINPNYIQNASCVDTGTLRLELKMSDGTKYQILDPAWIQEASKNSQIMKVLYDEFTHTEQVIRDEEYDRWIDQKAKEYFQSKGILPED